MKEMQRNTDNDKVRIWLFEDNPDSYGQFLWRIGSELQERCECFETMRKAMQGIGDIKDGDVASIDSKIDADPKAGARIVAEIRRQGKLCRLIWHGGSEPPVGMEESLVFEMVPGIDAAAMRAVALSRTRSLPSLGRGDAKTRGREWLASIDLSPLTSYLPLYVCCLGYLCAAGALNRRSRGRDTRNPVMDHLRLLPEKVRQCLLGRAEGFAEHAGCLVEAKTGRGWFDEALFKLQGDWEELRCGSLGSALMARVGRAGWRRLLEQACQMELDAENGFRGNGEPTGKPAEMEWNHLGEERFREAVAATSELCRHLLVLQEQQVSSEEAFSEEWFQRIRKAYVGLRFLARVFLNYSTDPLMKKRGRLNHSVSNNELGFLFQSERRAETERVLNGTVGENSGGDTERRLRKWPGIFTEILENVERIAREFDPICRAIEPLKGDFSAELIQWLGELTRETSRLWLGLNEWKRVVRESMEAFDLALPKEYRARSGGKEAPGVDIDKLEELFQQFRGEYSGKRYFNIAGRA